MAATTTLSLIFELFSVTAVIAKTLGNNTVGSRRLATGHNHGPDGHSQRHAKWAPGTGRELRQFQWRHVSPHHGLACSSRLQSHERRQYFRLPPGKLPKPLHALNAGQKHEPGWRRRLAGRTWKA